MHAAMFSYTLCCLLAYLDICKSTYMKGIDSCMFSWWLIHHKSLQLETWIQDGNHEWSFVTKKTTTVSSSEHEPTKKKKTHTTLPSTKSHWNSLETYGESQKFFSRFRFLTAILNVSQFEIFWVSNHHWSTLGWLPPPKKKNEKISKFHHVGPKVGSFFRNRFWLFSHLLLQKGMLSVTMIYFFFLQPSFFPCYAAPKNSYLLEMLAQKNKKNLPNDGLMVIDHE